jgi:hypothetical protein
VTSAADTALPPPPFPCQGFLIPAFHGSYWLGLMSSVDAWPAFNWTDPFMLPLDDPAGYAHWDQAQPDEPQMSLCAQVGPHGSRRRLGLREGLRLLRLLALQLRGER